MLYKRLYEDAEEWCQETNWRLDTNEAVAAYDIISEKTNPLCIRVRLHTDDTEDLENTLDHRGFVIHSARLTEYTELEVDIGMRREVILE